MPKSEVVCFLECETVNAWGCVFLECLIFEVEGHTFSSISHEDGLNSKASSVHIMKVADSLPTITTFPWLLLVLSYHGWNLE